MKTGRPRKPNTARNRQHGLILTEKAELLFREISARKHDKSWLHKFVSEKIIREFEINSEELILKEMLELQDQQKKTEERLRYLAGELAKIRELNKQVR